MWDQIIRAGAVIAGATAGLYGGWSTMLTILVVMTGIGYVTGVLVAATSEVIRDIIESIFPPEYVAVVAGGREENTCLLDEKSDYIFFTGSKAVGRLMLEKASKRLTPVTLELGGKSPCIVGAGANLKPAAERIAFGKALNCGQNCVAPDNVPAEVSVRDALVARLKAEFAAQYGVDPLKNPDYGRMVNRRYFDPVLRLIDPAKTVHGGCSNPDALQIEPTLMDRVAPEDAVMGEEIFGPVLPVLSVESLDEAIAFVNIRLHPLALYRFSSDKAAIRRVASECRFGGGCIDDTIIHLATSAMGFGGTGEGGMGAYHGKTGFDTFSSQKSILDKKTWFDLPMRYQPYTVLYGKLIRMFLEVTAAPPPEPRENDQGLSRSCTKGPVICCGSRVERALEPGAMRKRRTSCGRTASARRRRSGRCR